VSVNVKNAESCFANRVWKMNYVQIAKKIRRMKMNNKKQKSMNLRIQTDLRQRRSSWRVEGSDVALRFSPTAWAKLLYFRDKSDNEVGGFGITDIDDLLFVREFVTVKQEVTCVSVKFDDSAVADFFDTQVDLGRKPEQFGRIWLHSHPGDSPEPSVVDQETFERVFGACQWALMFVVAHDNKSYAKLRFNVGPGGQVLIPTEIDCSQDFSASDHELWDSEYTTNVKAVEWLTERSTTIPDSSSHDLSDYALPYDFLDDFEKMEPEERQFILDELADRPDLWDEEGVMTL
jgi:proteasome lid subunit RPN8/RPN11